MESSRAVDGAHGPDVSTTTPAGAPRIGRRHPLVRAERRGAGEVEVDLFVCTEGEHPDDAECLGEPLVEVGLFVCPEGEHPDDAEGLGR